MLADLAAEQNDATLAEYAERFAARTGTCRSVAAICQALQQLGWVRKQKALRASEQDRAEVAAARLTWRAAAGAIDPARLVFLDESGFDTRLVHTQARAPRGQRAHGQAPGGHWRRLTRLGALAREGLCAKTNLMPRR